MKAADSDWLRRGLLALILLGIVGLGAELFLLEHTESVWQWLPFGVLGAGLAAGVAVALHPSRVTIRLFQAAMALCVAVGVLGLYLHYDGNVAFERESDPAAAGWDLFWRSLRGATPALAPGALVQLGLLGLVWAFRHPALGEASTTGDLR